MRTYDEYDRLHAIALEQHSIFTASQARTAGVAADTVVKMVKRGRLERLAHGLYRDCGAPATRWTPYITAILWPLGATGVLSHETALAMMELSDVNPARTHITLPKRHRPRRRRPPSGVVLHFADLPPADVGSIEGLPATTAARTIRDCAQANLGPALIRQAIDDGRRNGWLAPTDADALVAELTNDGKL